jgi:hypothetical protein
VTSIKMARGDLQRASQTDKLAAACLTSTNMEMFNGMPLGGTVNCVDRYDLPVSLQKGPDGASIACAPASDRRQTGPFRSPGVCLTPSVLGNTAQGTNRQ